MSIINFTVDSALLSELGEKLVESVHVALLELIKNSYDADATSVFVGIYPYLNGGEIHIIDDGSGMTFDQLKSFWMKIATNNKLLNPISPKYGRPKSGAKGIGRFSCRRLGSNLYLETTAELGDCTFEKTKLHIDWNNFKSGTILSEINVDCESKKIKTGKIGTKLIIRNGIASSLNERERSYIKRHSSVLVANRGIQREGFQRDPGFNITFDFPEEGVSKSENLREKLINAGWGTVFAKVDEKGCAHINLNSINIKEKKFVSKPIFSLLPNVSLQIGILVERRDQIRDKEVLSLGVLREILSEWGGVYIRYKGIRITPYGGNGDDWLGIDRDRGLRKGSSNNPDIIEIAKSLKGITPNRYLLQLLSSRAYVGDVDIPSDLNGFSIKASREGFLSSEAFSQLVAFTRFAVDYATMYRDLHVRNEEEKAHKQAIEIFNSSLKNCLVF